MAPERVTEDGEIVSTPGPSAAMVRSAPEAFRMELEPHDLEGVMAVAERVAKIGLCGCKTAEDALARIMTGRELGLSAMTALRGVYVVDGTPSLSAKLKLALCKGSPLCEVFRHKSSDNKHATYVVKRRGEPEQEFTYTIEDAQASGLIARSGTKGAWASHPRRMLQARAMGEAADVVFGDVLLGIESDDEPSIERVEARVVPRPDDMVGGAAMHTSAYVAGVTGQRRVEDPASSAKDLALEALKAEIAAAKTKELKEAVVARIVTFAAEVGDPWGTIAKTFYKTCWTSPGNAETQTAPAAAGAS